MKTTKKNIILLFSLTILISLHLNATIAFFAQGPNKNYTSKIVNENTLNADFSTLDFSFEDEAYIDDIPFDTDCISAQCKYEKAMAVDFSFEEDKYVDDINF